VTYFGISAAGWAAWTAIGTLLLAAVTTGAVIVTMCLAQSERKRDDRLRREAADGAAERERTERRARQDYEARQVIVSVAAPDHQPTDPRAPSTHYLTVSTPVAYPIKQVDVQLVVTANGAPSIVSYSKLSTGIHVDNERVRYDFAVLMPMEADPIVRFTDWHGNRYYQFRHYTERFGPDTDWHEAARALDELIRTGPEPDEARP
jgi:hypothetical protein